MENTGLEWHVLGLLKVPQLNLSGYLGQLDNLHNLRHLNMACNSLSKNIPHSLSFLTNLSHLNLSHNLLSEPIGSVFTSLQSLKTILKMLMAWRSLQQRSCASTTPKILELSVALEGSTTFMALLEHGKVEGRRHQLPFAERLLLSLTSLRCGEMVFRRDLSPSLMNV
ncbi:hypothetical protein REPUB_Repub13aG0156700 [Reevesia pubescens]